MEMLPGEANLPLRYRLLQLNRSVRGSCQFCLIPRALFTIEAPHEPWSTLRYQRHRRLIRCWLLFVHVLLHLDLYNHS